jgi:ribosomal protein L9
MKKTLKKSESGGVFDSLRKEDILEFLKSHNIEIPKSSIDLPQPIKKDGQYSVPIYLLAAGKEHPALIATLRITLLLSPEP